MSGLVQDEEIIELACRIGDLHITVRGPSAQATRFLQTITTGSSDRRPSPSGSTEASFSVVSTAAPDHTVPARHPRETRDQIQASFAPCPGFLLQQGTKLSGSATSGSDRVARAWLAGQWSRATFEGRSHSPNRTPQLDLRSRFYAVLRAEGLERPTIYRSAKSYWSVVGDLSTSDSISHAFPSEQEARIYFAGADVSDFDIKP
eukprot:s3901_g7.t1